MEPRPIERGNHQIEYARCGGGRASMEPRPIERGHSAGDDRLVTFASDLIEPPPIKREHTPNQALPLRTLRLLHCALFNSDE